MLCKHAAKSGVVQRVLTLCAALLLLLLLVQPAAERSTQGGCLPAKPAKPLQRLLCRLPVPGRYARLEAFVDATSAQWRRHARQHVAACGKNCTHAVLTLTDAHYAAGFDNWARMTARQNSVGVVVALDSRACAAVAPLPRTLCMPPFLEYFPYRPPSTTLLVALAKILAPAAFLEQNVSVLFSEMDVFWQHDPFNLLAALPVDVAVSPHVD